ncbi:MAG: tpiA [Bacteroidetes bacterium]|nr:tpiA [Bacteroidota bacterium]
MRRSIIAGNWKMYNDAAQTAALIDALHQQLPPARPDVLVVVCPPFTSLPAAAERLRGSSIRLGAQNMSEHDEGAYTGEVSWKMLAAAGCAYVILGHSERRQYSKESDELINRKARTALAHGLQPILCVGETLAEREGNRTAAVVSGQVKGVLHGLTPTEMRSVVIAYEPVWAIGTGRNATPGQAQEVHSMIRGLVKEMFGGEVAEGLTIQYGGSVKPDNASDLLRQSDIDGALVGGASLKADAFSSIVRAAK